VADHDGAEGRTGVNTTVLLLPFALAALALGLTYRMARDNSYLAATGPVQHRVTRHLREQLTRGEISADDYNRLMALMR